MARESDPLLPRKNSETTVMAMQPRISAAFLADLDVVCPKADDGKLPLNFEKDLEDGASRETGPVL
jgi:hypothetical protein